MKRRFRLALLAGLLAVDLVAALVLLAILFLVAPLPAEARTQAAMTQTLLLATGYAAVASVVAYIMGMRLLRPVLAWLTDEARDPVVAQDRVLSAPLLFAGRVAALWLGGASLAALQAVPRGPQAAMGIGLTFAVGAPVAGALTYLVSERSLRPVAARALEAAPSAAPVPARFGRRLLFVWTLTSGAGLAGIGLVGGLALMSPRDTSATRLSVTILVLALMVLVIGFVAAYLAVRGAAEPIEGLRDALEEVESGRLDARVVVWDGTELGRLQAGFNKMAAGLEERERIREVFGRHVGTEVARAALAGANFDGEVRSVSVLFVDLVGSTQLAQEVAPEAVIRSLNEFFEVVIDTVHAHGGWINKFMGDAALAVWGAPGLTAEAPSRCLACARELATRLAVDVPDLEAGVGLSYGQAVAGNVGSLRRYEYTTIGDPVNEAARLTELAKAHPSRVLANAILLDHAGGDEREQWVELDPVVVRGRTEPTRVASLRPPAENAPTQFSP